ncbi:MAG TPA: DUF4142 domain-containing protein [Chthoniobacterales bacterium]
MTALATGALCFATPMFAQQDQESSQTGETTTNSATQGSEAAKAQASENQASGSKSNKSTSSNSRVSGGGTTSTKTVGTTSGPGANATTQHDQQFLRTAAADGMREVAMGKMAQQQGQSAEVKRLGNMMVTDHTQANTELMAVAQKHNVKISQKTPSMSSMKGGGNFDQQWLSEMIPAHQRAISLFQTEAKSGGNSEITGFASTTLPTLQKHLRELQKAQGGKTGSTTTNGWRRKNT